MDNQRGKIEKDLSWLAGIYEGEGSFGVNVTTEQSGKVGFFPHISLGNSDLSMMEEALKILHAHGVSGWISHRRMKSSVKLMHHLQLTGCKRVKAFLELLLPFMRTDAKRTDAVLVLEYVNVVLGRTRGPATQREVELFQELRGRHGRAPLEILRDFTPSPDSRSRYRVKIKSSPESKDPE